MTRFEELAKELNVKIETDSTGLFKGMCAALYDISLDVTLSDNETIFSMPWEEQKEIVKEQFYSVFPYMKK